MFTLLKKFFATLISLGFIILTAPVYAVDPPHNDTITPETWWCTRCHTQYDGGVQHKSAEGNPYICLNCHTTAGLANNKRLLSAEQAMPGTSGRNHRWDSGPGGYVTPGGANTSTGMVFSGVAGGQSGVFAGTMPRAYTITVNSGGDVGTATFNWTWQDEGGTPQAGGTNISTGTDISLNGNIKVTFANGLSPSFTQNDTWTIKVRPQINYPTTYVDTATNLTRKMFPPVGAPLDIPDVDPTGYVYPGSTYGKASCSTCHNQHYQSKQSFDPLSPSSYSSSPQFSNGEGRHFQRINNEQNQLCLDCHSARNKGNDFYNADPDDDVRTWTGNKKSHPVGVDFPSTKIENAALFHTVPKEPSTSLLNPGADMSDKATSGKATSTTNTICVTDTSKDFTNPSNNYYNPIGLAVYFPSQFVGNLITSYNANQVCWAAGNVSITTGDVYLIDVDGNPSNNFRFYNSGAGTISFTGGKVYCMTCHSLHWADSNETTYDAP